MQVVAVFEVADVVFAAGSQLDRAAEPGLSFVGLAGGAGSALAGERDCWTSVKSRERTG